MKTRQCPINFVKKALRPVDRYLSWLFYPKQFLFPDTNSVQTLRIPGWETMYFVDDPQKLQVIHKQTGQSFLGGTGNAFLGPLFGPQSVFLLDGAKHKVARAILSKCLSPRATHAMKEFIEGVVAEELAQAKHMGMINLGCWSRKLTMRVMAYIAWGERNPQDIQKLFNAFEKTTGILANFVSYNKKFWTSNRFFSVGNVTKYYVNKIDVIVDDVIGKRQCHSSQRCQYVLDYLVTEQSDHGYDNGFIRDNLVSVIGAGYDTTGSAITWMLYWLSRLTIEDYALLCRDREDENPRGLLKSFISESLRYCPPIEILPRSPVETSRGQISEILKDAEWANSDHGEPPLICPFIHRTHHNDNYFPNPEKFDMHRFLGLKARPNVFMPFGGGERLCLGMHLGLTILETVLTSLLKSQERFVLKNHAFRPIRRNVSIWPGFRVLARLHGV